MSIIEFSNKIFNKLKIKILTKQEEDRLLASVRTAKWAKDHSTESLEFYELVGDKFLQYIFTLFCDEVEPFCKMRSIEKGESICSRMIIKYLSTKYLSKICRDIGLYKYIDYCTNETMTMEQIYEDAFEAWIGACSKTFNFDKVKEFLFEQFKKLGIDMTYDSIVDARTRLNDYLACINGRAFIKSSNEISNGYRVEMCFQKHRSTELKMLTTVGVGKNIKDAELNAASLLLDQLKKMPDYTKNINNVVSYRMWQNLKRSTTTHQESERELKKRRYDSK
jgi:dsRNA-specific ribonuclease